VKTAERALARVFENRRDPKALDTAVAAYAELDYPPEETRNYILRAIDPFASDDEIRDAHRELAHAFTGDGDVLMALSESVEVSIATSRPMRRSNCAVLKLGAVMKAIGVAIRAGETAKATELRAEADALLGDVLPPFDGIMRDLLDKHREIVAAGS